MSTNPSEIKSQHELNEGKRKSDVLLKAIDEMEILKTENKWYSEQLHEASEKCERLQKQLDIAVKCLKKYANEDYWLYCCKACGGSYYTLHKDKINLEYGEYPARDALINIKELNK